MIMPASSIQDNNNGSYIILEHRGETYSSSVFSFNSYEETAIWLDARTADSLLLAANTIQDIQTKAGQHIGCIEEMAYRQGWITLEQVHKLGANLRKTPYGEHLTCI